MNVTTDKHAFYAADGDTLSLCIDSVITLKAQVFNSSVPVESVNFQWNFDDGQIKSGIGLDSVIHKFSKGGGFRIKLFADDGVSKVLKILPVHVSLKPDFKDTKIVLPEGQTGICKGGKAQLSGKAHALKWKDKPVYITQYSPAKEIPISKSDTFYLLFDEFPPNTVFSDGNIDSVGFKAEHSDMGSLEIKLICPDNQSVILKNYSTTNHAFLGEPNTDPAHPELIGIPYQYYWNTGASSGLMNNFAGITIPASAYAPDGLFSNLNGCPMNGNWKLVVSDNSTTENGYTFSWNILFKKSILPSVWTFRDTIVDYYHNGNVYLASLWESSETVGSTSLNSVGDTILNATAIGRPKVTADFTYTAINNRGCTFDTAIVAKVERVKMTVTPALTVYENDTIGANIEPGTVTWAKTYKWNFGDMTNVETTETVSHSYIKAGTYKLIVVVADSAQCTDTDTATIIVNLEKTELQMTYNCFTPNGDRKNDNFTVGRVKGMVQFSFMIFNAWGEKMYETNSVTDAVKIGWDGKSALTKLTASPGIYYYYIQYLGKDGTRKKVKGTLQLFR